MVHLKIVKYSQKVQEVGHKTTLALDNFVIIVFCPVSQTSSQLFCSLCFSVADQRKTTSATFPTMSRMKKKVQIINRGFSCGDKWPV